MFTTKSSRRRILLLYPETPDTTYWSFSHALHLLGKRALMPPLGLLTVAGMVPPDHELRLKDLNIESCADEEILWADAVFISAMIAQKESLANGIAQANRLGIPIIAGGPYPTTSYAEIAGVSHFVLGEAEAVFPVFFRDWDQGCAKRAYARPTDTAEADKLRHHFGADADVQTATGPVSLDDSPLPRFDLLDTRAYKAMPIQTSRGCPHGCEFCDIWRRFGRRTRYKSPSRVLAELTELYRLGWRSSIFIVDDNFVGNPTQAKSLLGAIANWQHNQHYPFDFCTEASLALADDEELLRGMAAAGCDMVFLGLETPIEENLRETRKFVNTSGSMAERVRRIQAVGIHVTSGFILGFDNDPDDIAERMLACIEDLGVPVAMVGLLQAFPGTDLHDRLKRDGRLRQASDGNNTHEFSLSFTPRRPAAALVADYKKVLQALYPPDLKSYFVRCARLRERWGGASRATVRPTRWFEVKWFLRYLASSLFTAYGWNSLRFLLETAWKNPRFLPMAVSLGIQGHHFREITRLAFRIEELKVSYAELIDRFFARLRYHQMALQREFSRSLQEGRGAVMERADAALAAIEQYRQSLLQDASRRARRLPRRSRQAAISIYRSLCSDFARAITEFRRSVAELVSGVTGAGACEAALDRFSRRIAPSARRLAPGQPQDQTA